MTTSELTVRAAAEHAAPAPVRGLGRLRDEVWSIGRVDSPVRALLDPGARLTVRWSSPHPAGFLADPFLLSDGSTLCELYAQRGRRGSIVRVHGDERIEVVHQPEHHVSYPFTIQHADGQFVVLEQSTQPGIVLHEWTGDGLIPVSTLVPGIRALDPTVFHWRERWWLWCSDTSEGPSPSHVHVFHAPDLLGPWEPHGGSPVRAGAPTMRSAGTPFVVDGELYRPTQDCRGGYGRRVLVHRVVELSPAAYREEAVTSVAIDSGPHRHGVHTIAASADGQRFVLDGKQRPHSWRVARRAIRRRVPVRRVGPIGQ